MRIISRKALRTFWEKPAYADSEQPLKAWHQVVKKSDWKSPAEIKEFFRSASFVGNSRVVFNIAGNKYRLVVNVEYRSRVVYIRFIGTHRQYDKIDVKKV